MSKSSTDNNLKVARFKDNSSNVVKSSQYSSKDKVREEHNHAAHIKVKSYNTDRTITNGSSTSGYTHTRLSSIQKEQKKYRLSRQLPNQTNPSYPTYGQTKDNSSQNRSSNYPSSSNTVQKPRYYQPTINQSSIDGTKLDSLIKPISGINNLINSTENKQSVHLSKIRNATLIRSNDHRLMTTEKNILGSQNSKSRYASSKDDSSRNNNKRYKLTKPSEIQSLTEVRTETKPYSRYTEGNPRYSTHQKKQTGTNRARLKLIRSSEHRLLSGQMIEPYSTNRVIKFSEDRFLTNQIVEPTNRYTGENTRYSAQEVKPSIVKIGRLKLIKSSKHKLLSNKIVESNSRYTEGNPRYSTQQQKQTSTNRTRLKLIRSSEHRLLSGQIVNPNTRYTTGSVNSSLKGIKELSRKKSLFEKLSRSKNVPFGAKSVENTVKNLSRNTDNDDLGTKSIHKTASEISKIPRYSQRGKQILKITHETTKNIQGVFSKNRNISEMISENKLKKRGITSALTKSFKDRVANVESNGDLGVDTVIKTKNAIFKTHKTIKASGRAIKGTMKSAKWATKATTKSFQVAKYLVLATKATFKLALNPIVLKGALIAAAISMVLIACIAAISGVTSVYAALTYTSDKDELNDTWKYITELDTQLEREFETAAEDPKWEHIDQVHHYMMYYPWTSASQVIAYLTAKYDDFEFNEVKDEILSIHEQLYDLNYREWTEEKEICSLTVDGEEICETELINHLDITLSGKPFSQWLKSSGGLNASQKERYDNTLELGGTIMLSEFGNPFGDEEWFEDISSRFGYRLDPITKEMALHEGIDIAKPEGTEINSISSGIVETGFDDSMGNYVIVTNSGAKKTVRIHYYHLNDVFVTNGQKVKKGNKIGTIGNTGKSTGAHLHLGYELDGVFYNPWFYVEGAYGVDSDNNYNPSLNIPSFSPGVIASNGWAWPTQSTRITSPYGWRIHPFTKDAEFHKGIDIGRITNSDPVQSMAQGTVVHAGWYYSGGNTVIIDHGNGIKSYYMHLKTMAVNVGDIVDTSQVIGIMGTTGGSTGIHLHFEIRVNGESVDPMYLFSR